MRHLRSNPSFYYFLDTLFLFDRYLNLYFTAEAPAVAKAMAGQAEDTKTLFLAFVLPVPPKAGLSGFPLPATQRQREKSLLSAHFAPLR